MFRQPYLLNKYSKKFPSTLLIFDPSKENVHFKRLSAMLKGNEIEMSQKSCAYIFRLLSSSYFSHATFKKNGYPTKVTINKRRFMTWIM